MEGFEIKREKVYLSNEDIEKEEWELIHIDVRPTGKIRGTEQHYGLLDIRFAYKDDIRDTFMYQKSGKIHLGKTYPNFIKREILSHIKAVIADKTPKKITPKVREDHKPTPITIKRTIKTEGTHITIKRTIIKDNGTNTQIN